MLILRENNKKWRLITWIIQIKYAYYSIYRDLKFFRITCHIFIKSQSEGFANFVKSMLKVMSISQARTRMMNVQSTFRKHREYLGYGIYCYEKPLN